MNETQITSDEATYIEAYETERLAYRVWFRAFARLDRAERRLEPGRSAQIAGLLDSQPKALTSLVRPAEVA